MTKLWITMIFRYIQQCFTCINSKLS